MRVQRILTLDGGGIRGLVGALWLEALERRLDAAGKGPLHNRFDLVAGSSTGALVAAGLGIGLRAAQIVALYESFGDDVFARGGRRLWSRVARSARAGISAPRYSATGLEAVLRRVFGARTFGSVAPRTMAIAYDTLARQPLFFKSFRAEHADVPLWEVCRAATAAPSYFPAHVTTVEGRRCALVDGGVVANNPTACAIAEAVRLNDDASLDGIVLLSIGTGQATRPISVRQATTWGALEWAIPIIDVLFDGSSDSVDYIARQLLGEAHYVRMQAPLPRGGDGFDNVGRANLAALRRTAEAYLQQPATQSMLDRLVALL